MATRYRQSLSILCTISCLAWLLPAGAQQAAKPAAAPTQKVQYTFTANTNMVLVDLTARDSHGNLITDLKQNEVSVYEDGKLQHIVSWDFENVDHSQPSLAAAAADNGPEGTTVNGTAPVAKAKPAANTIAPTATNAYRDRRLIVLYFDLTTMQPEDVQNVIQQAQAYVKKTMLPADLASVVTLGNNLDVPEDFTSNKTALLNTLQGLNPAASSGFADGATGSSEGTADDGNSFVADDTEFNIANADRSLEAVQSVCDMLRGIEQQKSLIYFSSGVQRSGVDNEITLRSAVNSCVKSNTHIYSVDARGLQAMPPGGDSTQGSIRGQSAFNGGAQSSTLSAQFAQQETISTLATDTGGRAFLSSNNFGKVYSTVQNDTSSYYLIGYISTNPRQDGKYRKIRIVINRPGAKASARPGYFAPRDLNHMNTSDRKQQLDDELNADVADHSLDLYLTEGYLRLNNFRYYVPVSIIIPGNEIPLHGINPKDTPQVEIEGEVIDQGGRQLDHVYQTIKLTAALAGPGEQLHSKNLQYSTGFVLPPGEKYQVRFAAREDQTGQMGAFEAIEDIPNLTADETKNPHALSMSSVLVGSQLAATRPDPTDPLTRTGRALVLSVSHVFDSNQKMYLYYEVYDPKFVGRSGDQIHLLTNVAFYHGRVKVFASQLISTEKLTDPSRNAAVIQISIPLSQLKPGYYLCQVNAVDDAAGKFAFPRIPVLIRPAVPAAGAATGTPPPRDN